MTQRGAGWGKGGSFLPFYFHVRAFSIPADPTISEPGPGYTVIVTLSSSSFPCLLFVCLFVFSHSVWWWFLLFDKFRDTAPFIIFICISLIVKKNLSVPTSISFILSFQSKSNKHNTFIIAKVTFLKHHPYKCFVCLHARNNRKA